MPILLDLDDAEFQANWFTLKKEDRAAVLQACAKLSAMEWNDVYKDNGLNCEMIKSRTSPDGSRIYSIRVSRKFRAAVLPRGKALSFISLHPDHDSAYQ